jgi:hypothetical protein
MPTARSRSRWRKPLSALFGTLLIAVAALIALPTTARATSTAGPCDIYQSYGTPCAAAHSTVRTLFAGYTGPLYQLTRASDGTTHDVHPLSDGYANAADHDAFCAAATCTITKIYDQTPNHNDLLPGPQGSQGTQSPDRSADASALAITAGGHKAYGLWITPGVGYRSTPGRAAVGVAVNGQPEGAYMVASGTHVNSGCCFDYGNAEAQADDTGAGHMDAVNLGTTCFFKPCTGSGPWVAADLENGLFQGAGTNNSNSANLGNSSPFVTAMLKNNGSTFAVKGGNAQTGGLSTWWNGPLPTGYTMQQEGGIILGTGGDNSNWAEGTFFEGVMTAGYPSDAADNAVQANIASVGYSGQTSVPNEPHSIVSGSQATIIDHNGATVVYALGLDGKIYENYQTIPGGGGWSGWEQNLGSGFNSIGVWTLFVSAPSVFVDSFGKTVVTAIDGAGNVQENYQTVPAGGPWFGWHYYSNSPSCNSPSCSSPLPSGVKFVGTPFATKDTHGTNVTYATGTDGNVYENWHEASGYWSGWELALGANGALVSSPSVFVDSAGKTVVTAIDRSGNVEENYQTVPGGGPWYGWHLYSNSALPAGVKFVGTPYATKDTHGTNVTYATGTDGNVYENYLTPTAGWYGWELALGNNGTLVSSPSVFVDSAGDTVVTAIDKSGNVQEDYQTVPGGGGWSGWHPYSNSPLPAGVSFVGMPNSLKDKNGTNITYELGTDGKLYENYLQPNGWFGWELALGTPPVGLTEF